MPAAAFTTNRLLLYGAVSTALASVAVYTTFSTHSNYYSAVVHLSKSNGSILTLANFLVFVSLLIAKVMQFIFFGPLRATEVERLYDRTWYFLTESLLAFTIFREDFDAAFVCLFGGLLFVKSFHWLLADRVEAMDQQPYPGPPKSFHIRTIALFNLLALVDVVMIASMAEIILHEGVDGLVLFLSEYAILLASLLNCWLKYLISVYDIYRASRHGGDEAPPWEHKSMYIFYVELLTDFLKLSTYLSFFLTVLTYYGLPLNIVRDVFLTARSFVGRVRDLLRYRAATRDMDHRYPDAQASEMEALGDRTCIICREEMISRTGSGGGAVAGGPNTTPKKLPCGHIFHFHCLRSWLERQQSCPTCRRTVLESGRPTLPNNANGNANGNANPALPNPAGPAAQNQQGAIALFNRAWNGLGQAPPPAAQAPPQPAQGAAPPPLFAQPPTPFPWAPNPGQVNPPAWMQAPPQPRQFQGFNAGGQWHPWGAPPPENEREQRQQVDSNATGGLFIPGQPGLVTSPAPIERDGAPIQLNHPITGPNGPPPPAPTPVRQIIPVPNKTPPEAKEGASATSTGSAPGGSGSGQLGTTPREAAALAALRRFQAGRSTESLKPPAPAPAAGASPALTPGTPTPTPTVPRSAPGSVSAAVPISPPRGSGQAPALIPLYNPGAVSSAGGPGAATPSPYFAGASGTSTPLIDVRPHASPLPRSPLPPFGQSSGSSAYFAPSQMAAQTQSQGSLPRPGQLPPNLTDAQLGQLDRLTREAIDERLRVLEGVQSTVWRCVEDLTRLRSALPETATGVAALRLGGGARSETSASASRETSIGSSFGVEIERELRESSGSIVSVGGGEGEVDVKGKGKDVAESSGEERVPEQEDASTS